MPSYCSSWFYPNPSLLFFFIYSLFFIVSFSRLCILYFLLCLLCLFHLDYCIPLLPLFMPPLPCHLDSENVFYSIKITVIDMLFDDSIIFFPTSSLLESISPLSSLYVYFIPTVVCSFCTYNLQIEFNSSSLFYKPLHSLHRSTPFVTTPMAIP